MVGLFVLNTKAPFVITAHGKGRSIAGRRYTYLIPSAAIESTPTGKTGTASIKLAKPTIQARGITFLLDWCFASWAFPVVGAETLVRLHADPVVFAGRITDGVLAEDTFPAILAETNAIITARALIEARRITSTTVFRGEQGLLTTRCWVFIAVGKVG